MKQNKKNALLGLGVFAVYVILDLFIDETLLEYTYQLYFAAKNQSEYFIEISNFLKSTSLNVCELIFLYLYLSFNKKLDVLLLLLFSCFLTGTHAFLKEIYNQGRPYMLNPDVATLECISELGKPSGHTICIISYMISFFRADQIENGVDMKYPNLKGTLYTLFAIIVATSRVLLGVHSLGQVFYGTVFTLCMYIIYLNYGHNKLKKLLHKYIKHPNHILTGVTAILFFTFLTLSLSADYYSRNYFATHSDVYYKYIDAIQSCRKQNNLPPLEDESGFVLQRSTVASYGFYHIIIGAMLGLVIFRGYYEESLYEVQAKFRTRLTLFIRVVIFFLGLLGILKIIAFLSKSQNTHEGFLFIIVVGFIFLGLFITLIFPLLMYFCGMEIYGSMQCVNKSTLFIDYSHIWESESMISV